MADETQTNHCTKSSDNDSSNSNHLRISFPTVELTPDVDNKSNYVTNSDSIMSLPSSLDTPTSPLKVSSPMSLPTSPSPFVKISTLSPPQPPPPPPPQLPLSSNQQRKTLDQGLLTNVPSAMLNSGSATGNPRNKCALQPGHSLMDWIRLGNSGRDLTGVGGRLRPVTRQQLAKHNTPKDAWLAIRGRVYNVTHYLPFHPGGHEELMRGVGTDATKLFDKVHPWVNFESLLSKCIVGPLSSDLPDAQDIFGSTVSLNRLKEPTKTDELVRKSMENLANCISPGNKKISLRNDENKSASRIMQSLIQSSELPLSISRRAGVVKVDGETPPPPLRHNWIQTSTKLTISLYTGALANPGVSAKLKEGNLLLEVVTDGWLRTLKLCPESGLEGPLQLRSFHESGKVEVTASKSTPNIWLGLGTTHCEAATRVLIPATLQARLCAPPHVVTHDTKLMTFSCETASVIIPLGYHVRVHANIDDGECTRSYTPVGEGWSGGSIDHTGCIRLVIKSYPSGKLSQHLTGLAEDSAVHMSGPFGSFRLDKLKAVQRLYLIAAGTGITPMLGLTKFMLTRNTPRCERMSLLFFNKKEEDIMFRDNFQDITKEDHRFICTHVLSEASNNWTGPRGRISLPLLSDMLDKEDPSSEDNDTYYVYVCGPSEFTNTCGDLLKQLGVRESHCHAFLG